jgi:hypothetical protein
MSVCALRFRWSKPHGAPQHTRCWPSRLLFVCATNRTGPPPPEASTYRQRPAAEKEDYATGTTDERPTGCISPFVHSFGPVNVCLCVLWFYEGAPHKAAFDGRIRSRTIATTGVSAIEIAAFTANVYHEQTTIGRPRRAR